MKDLQLFLPMYQEARNCLLKFLSQELVIENLKVISYKKKYVLTDRILKENFQVSYNLEMDFYYYISSMSYEIEQIFKLTSPLFQDSIREEIKNRFNDLSKEFTKKNLLKLIIENNSYETDREKLPSGDFYYSSNSIKEKKEITNLKIGSPEFKEFHEFMKYLLERFKNQLAYVFEVDGTTDEPSNYSFIEKRGSNNEQVKPYNAVYEFNDFLLNPDKFYEFCDMLSEKIELQDGRMYRVITKIDDIYLWNGNGKGNGIPFLGAFLYRLDELKIFRVRSEKKYAEMIMRFFSIPIEGENYKFLMKHISDVNNNYSSYFLKIIC
ncbi:MAG: hypothetical protein COA31_007650 [Flavobacteriales bacterium]|nr:hypothetical protein [Flavobacteriales bacterium]